MGTVTNKDEIGLIFGKWQLARDTWVITNRWQNFIYLLIGEEKALLIDSGYGEGNLREVVESITSKPVMVINTHGHFDHTGGNALWDEAWMAQEAISEARQPFNEEQELWFKQKPHQAYTVHTVTDGDTFDLGGRRVEVITIPAHSEGSIALLDHKERLLFCGDELESGQVLLFVRNKNITLSHMAAVHKANMEKLKARIADYDLICPAHNGTPLTPGLYLEDFIELDTQLINGTAQIMPDTAGFGFPTNSALHPVFGKFGSLKRAQYGQASFIFMEEKGEQNAD